MKNILVPEAEYIKLQEENNSLRELINQFVGKAADFLPGIGADIAPPPVLKKAKPKKLSAKAQKIAYLKSKI